MIRVTRFSSSVGGKQLFTGRELSIDPGVMTILSGPSGSGKSQFLAQLCGLLPGLDATLEVDGNAVTEPLYKAVNLGMVFQRSGLIDSLTVVENLRLCGWPHQFSDEKKMREGLAWFDLENAAGQFPDELSEGMKRRVSIIRAGLMNPRLILMDEPLAGLDADMRSKSAEWWQRWLANDIAIMMTTHIWEELSQLPRNRYRIDSGEVVGDQFENM